MGNHEKVLFSVSVTNQQLPDHLLDEMETQLLSFLQKFYHNVAIVDNVAGSFSLTQRYFEFTDSAETNPGWVRPHLLDEVSWNTFLHNITYGKWSCLIYLSNKEGKFTPRMK